MSKKNLKIIILIKQRRNLDKLMDACLKKWLAKLDKMNFWLVILHKNMYKPLL